MSEPRHTFNLAAGKPDGEPVWVRFNLYVSARTLAAIEDSEDFADYTGQLMGKVMHDLLNNASPAETGPTNASDSPTGTGKPIGRP